jgi:hypothetical protein
MPTTFLIECKYNKIFALHVMQNAVLIINYMLNVR